MKGKYSGFLDTTRPKSMTKIDRMEKEAIIGDISRKGSNLSSQVFSKGQNHRNEKLRSLISPRKGEKLLVDLPPLVNIRMQVNLRGLDRSMTEIFLNNAEIL